MITSNRQMKERCMRAWDYLQKPSGLLLNADFIRKAHKTMMGNEKGVLAGEFRKSLVFSDIVFFLPPTPLRGWLMTLYIVITIPMALTLTLL